MTLVRAYENQCGKWSKYLFCSSSCLLLLPCATILSTFEAKPDRNISPTVINMAFRSLFVSTLAAHASAVWLAGVNIAGCEIGIDTSVSKRTQIFQLR